jgi:hypothetical protein
MPSARKEETMHRCPECGKEYQSKSGLRRHRKRAHRPEEPEPDQLQIEPDEPQDAEDLDTEAWLMASNPEEAQLLAQACRALAVQPTDVMAWKVYPDRVVIVEGPVGYKRTWNREE